MKFLQNQQKNSEKYRYMDKNDCFFLNNQCFMNSFLPEEDEEDSLLSKYLDKNSIEENLENLVKNSQFLTLFDISNKNKKIQLLSFIPEKLLIKDM